MNETFLENPSGLWGLITAIVALIIVFYINRKIGRKKHLFDERYRENTNTYKAKSWDSMVVIYFVAWFVVIIFDGISFSFFLLTALFVLHNLTAIITNLYFLKKE